MGNSPDEWTSYLIAASAIGTQAAGRKKPHHLTGGALMFEVDKGESGFEFNASLTPLFTHQSYTPRHEAGRYLEGIVVPSPARPQRQAAMVFPPSVVPTTAVPPDMVPV